MESEYINIGTKREIEGTVKTLTIKRTSLGELFMVIVVDDEAMPEIKFETSKIAGFDFGLHTFLISI